MKKGSQYLIGAVIIAGVVDLFMANRVYLKKKGVVLRDMVLTSLDETARGRGRSREKNAPQSEQDAQQSIWQADTPQFEQDAQQNITPNPEDGKAARNSGRIVIE